MKHKLFRFNRYTAGILVLVIIAAGVGVAFWHHGHTDAAASKKPGIGAAVPSEFSFADTIGWWQGATNKTSMALFHNAQDCFTSDQYKKGTVNVALALRNQQTTLTNQGYTVKPAAVKTLALQTSTGQQSYQLFQYSVTTPSGASQVEGGQEFGYVPLTNGYVYIEAYCDTPSELSATIPALDAVTFKAPTN